MKIKKHIIALMTTLLVITAHLSWAGIYTAHERIFTPYQGTPVTIGQPEATAGTGFNPVTDPHNDFSIKNLFTLGVDANYPQFFGTAMDVKVILDVQRWDENGNALLPNETVELEIKYHPFDNNPYIDKNTKLSDGAYFVNVSITAIEVNNVSVNDLPANLFVDIDVVLERYYEFTSAATPMTLTSPVPTDPDEILDTDCDGFYDEVVITWDNITGAEEYQLEWTYVNDYGTTAGTFIDADDLPFDFRNNATRITTTNTYYNITLAFDHGYVLFRVRGIGRDINDPSEIITGVWSAADNGTDLTQVSCRYDVTTPHEEDKNWQFSTTFAEEGKKKDVVSYFDGSLRNRQTVTKINSDDNTIVGETIYDHQGRPAVTVLPVPVIDPDCSDPDEESSIKFYPNFNQNIAGDSYSKTDFDISDENDTCSLEAAGMGTQSGASNYYSESNPDKTGIQAYVPNAETYPFTQVEYTPDNTGRIRRQSGVGDDFKLGSTHETKYFYEQPFQIQLDRLFGSEVGDAAHYKKNMVIDPNGQVSVSYLDQEGRVVATALAGDAPPNLEAIESENNAAVQLTANLFTQNADGSQNNKINADGNAIVYSSQLGVAYPTTYVFDYSMNIDTLFDECLPDNICFNCVYDLEIQVKDECGINLAMELGSPISRTIGKFDITPGGLEFLTQCDNPTEFTHTSSFSIDLPVGTYTISKILTLNADAREFYINAYLDPAYNGCIKTLEDFEAEYLAGIDTNDCFISCEECVESLGSRDDFVSQGKGTAVEYDLLVEECNQPCKDITLCEASYQMMLADVSPGGQYAEFMTSTGVNDPAAFALSVLNENNALPGIDPHWRRPHAIINGVDYFYYMDEDGSRSKIFLAVDNNGNFSPAILPSTPASAVVVDPVTNQAYTYSEWLLSVSDFIAAFKPTWAKSLVTFHPEFCYYQTCTAYSEKQSSTDNFTSESFDARMIRTNTYADAVSQGFINPTNALGPIADVDDRLENWFVTSSPAWDPFVIYGDASAEPFYSYGSELHNKFLNYYNDGVTNYSMPEFAAMIVRCGNNLAVVPGANCYRFGDDFVVGNTVLNDQIRDQEWVMLKSLYRSEKQKLQNQRADDKTLTTCSGFNDCIGDEDFNPYASGFFTNTGFGNYFSNPFYIPSQPCSFYTYQLYVNKVKRFPDENDIPVNSADEAAYQQFLQTGQCPNAFALQTLLSSVAAHDALDASNESLDAYPELQAFFLAANNFTVQFPTPSMEWQTTLLTSTQITAQLFDMDNNYALCEITLDISGTSITSWDDIEGLTDLQSIGTYSPYTFSAHAVIDNNGVLEFEEITGSTTCTDISRCRFQNECEPNQLALDLATLMSALATNNDLTGTNIDLESSVYNITSPAPASVATTTIRNAVGSPNNDLRWSYNSTTQVFSLFDAANSSVKLNISINSVEPATFNLATLSSIAYFGEILSEYENAFTIEAFDSNNDLLVTIHGDVQHEDNGNTPVPMGECELPQPIACEGEGFDVAEDLEALLRDVLVTQNFTTNIDLFTSVQWTSLLQSYLTPGITSTSSTYSENVSPGFHSDKLTFTLNGCELVLEHSDDNNPPRSFNEIVALSDFTATGTTDLEGNMNHFYFIAEYEVNAAFYTDTVFGSTCFPLRNCKACPDSSNFDEPDSLIIAQQDQQFLLEGKTVKDQSVQLFIEYKAAVDDLNDRMGWMSGDSMYVNAQAFSEYFLKGMSFPGKSYIKYIKHFDPDVDEHRMLCKPDTFVTVYGYATNVKQEHKRYERAMNRYNQRAVAQGLGALAVIDELTFAQNKVADSLYLYVDYIEQEPAGSQPAEDVVYYMATREYVTESGNFCDSLYDVYAYAYKQFETDQQSNNTCINYQLYAPLYSLSDFMNNNLCCSTEGFDAINDYIAVFTSSTQCPGALPLLQDCNTPSEIDTSACQKLYLVYQQAVTDFNNSPWAMANGQNFAALYGTFNQFIMAGKCSCVEDWLRYIQTYIDAQATDILPVAQSIDSYSGCPQITQPIQPEPCEEAYNQYLNCIAVYNEWALANDGQPVTDIVKFETFFTEQLCFCVDAYCTSLNSIMNGLVENQNEIKARLSIIRVCDFVSELPCTPELPLNTSFISPPVPYSNPCAEYMINMALENAENAYNLYIDNITTYIGAQYTNHCMGAAETFVTTYTDKEYHFTLYYYDQAGNLVKTVPPEGVEQLRLDTNYPGAVELIEKIEEDRTNNTHTVFTQHRMATVYEYNSLNQLVKQSMPDHDKMDIFEITLPNGLNAALVTNAIQMVNSNLGYLSGNVGTRGYLYRTNDGGVTWTRMNDIVASDLKKIQMVNAATGYAVGNNGIVLKTTDGGNNWDMLNTYQYNIIEHLNDLHFINATTGVIVGDKSRILKTTDGGNTFTSYLLNFTIPADQHIKAITHDGTAYYLTATRPDGIVTPVYSVIFRSVNANNAASWNIENQISSVSINDVSVYTLNHGFAAGIDGSLLHTDGTFFTAVAANTNYEFKQVLFKDGLEGIALLETSPGVFELFKTHDAGANWQLMSEPGDNYTRLYMYLNDPGYGAKVIAVGKNGLVQRVIMENNTPFGIIDLNSPTTDDITSCWGQEIPGNLYLVLGSSTGNIYTTSNGSDNTVTWTTLAPAPLSGTYAKVIEAKVLTGGNAVSGTILDANGQIYALFKPNANVLFSVTPVGGLPLTYSMADLTIDIANERIFTFDNMNDKAHKLQLSAGSPATTTTAIPQTNAIAQCNDITFTDNKLVLAGTNGEIFVGALNIMGNALAGVWQNRTNAVLPLPLNDIQFSATGGLIYAAGMNGSILERQTSGNWKTEITSISENINRINFSSATNALIAGDNGLVADATVSGSTVTVSPYTTNTTNDLHDVVRSGNTVYVAGENGTVLFTPNLAVNNFAVTNQYTTKDFYGIVFKPSTTQAYAVGENSLVHWCIGSSRTVVKNVFAPALKDVHFADANNGTLIGDNFTIRKTNDGGVNWKVVLPSDNQPAGIVLNEVQTIDDNYAIVVGNNKYLGVIENTISTNNNALITGSAANLLSVGFVPGGLGGYIGNNKSKLLGVILTPVGNSYTIFVNNLLVGAPAPSLTSINGLHVFDNGSVAVACDNNFAAYFDGNAIWVPFSLPVTGATFNDIFFHDHLNGYLAGDNGILLKSKNTSLNANSFLTGTTWIQKSITDNLNINSNTQADINAIAFATRYNGVWGGKYNIANTTQYPYVRLIRDESELFSTYFFYDKLGRIVVSQNTKQHNAPSINAGPRRFSYTLYDELGRVIEAGEKSENSGSSNGSGSGGIGNRFVNIFGTTIANYYNPKVIDDAKLNTWIADNTGERKEVTRSYYDKSVITGLPVDFIPNPETQRKRITHVTYEDVFDNNDQTFDHATHYDYDIHGNVKTLLQDNRKLATTGTSMQGGATNPVIASERFKRIDYNYDLISGNVHSVSYQNGQADAWHHAYHYDADNRITEVYTSNAVNTVSDIESQVQGGSIINSVMDNHLWDNDSKYFYFAHGSLARVETGDNQVQGCDYVYTLQGWIKGVNSNTLNENNDPGQDGKATTINEKFARDVYGYSLNYFSGDYAAIDPNKNLQANSFTASINGSDIEANRFNLFNGNIGSMITTITNPTTREILPLGNAYKYDQLNRLLQAVSYDNIDLNSANTTTYNQFGIGGSQKYFNQFTYDANGNITSQIRNDDQNSTIDDMQYRYAKDGNGKMIQNRLYHVNDDTDYDGNDIDDMFNIHPNPNQDPSDLIDPTEFVDDLNEINLYNNYSYTEIGELKRDNQEEIAEIVWRADSKVKEVIRKSGSSKKNLKFEYDAMGNRIAKHIYSNSNIWEKSTFYILDAQGHVMSVYEETMPNALTSYQLKEQHIYGSSRIGMRTDEKEMIAATVDNVNYKRELGKKHYEFSNHLGNVLSVISDKKIPVEGSTPGEVEYFITEILTATDYSPFGVTLTERDFTSEKYRYGFNGMEKDDEVKGNGNSYSTLFRQLDPRLGRWLSIDPELDSWQSPYSCMDNNPIALTDYFGNDIEIGTKKEIKDEKAERKIEIGTKHIATGDVSIDKNKITEGEATGITTVTTYYDAETKQEVSEQDYLDNEAIKEENRKIRADNIEAKKHNAIIDLKINLFTNSSFEYSYNETTGVLEKPKLKEGVALGDLDAADLAIYNQMKSTTSTYKLTHDLSSKANGFSPGAINSGTISNTVLRNPNLGIIQSLIASDILPGNFIANVETVFGRPEELTNKFNLVSVNIQKTVVSFIWRHPKDLRKGYEDFNLTE